MIKIGITGGIGSGKSLVTSLFRMLNIPVYIADEESKRLTNSDEKIRRSLTFSFGEKLYEYGYLNKQMLATLIFNDEKNLRLVNSIIHPVVLDDFLKWINKHNHHPIVAMESAILFESSFNNYVDKIIAVTAPLDTRINRVIARDKVTTESVLQRMTKQMPEEEKCKLADFTIFNDDEQAIIPQFEFFFTTLAK